VLDEKRKINDKWESQWLSGIGATICQAQGDPGSTPAWVKTSIHQKKMTTHEKFILLKTIGIYSALLKSKSIYDHQLDCTRVKKEIKKVDSIFDPQRYQQEKLRF